MAYGEHGRIMLNGEWESSRIIYNLMSQFIPEPFGFGQYKRGTLPTYFYLSEFVDMDVTTAPDPVKFTARLAAMHRDKVSLTGKFGFQVTTFDGKMAHTIDWKDS